MIIRKRCRKTPRQILQLLHKQNEAGERAMNKQKIDKRQTATPLPFILRDSAEVQLDVGFYAQGQLLAWDAQRWHDEATVGTSWPGRG